MDIYEEVAGSPGAHWRELQPVPIIYAGFVWWVWCALAFNREQWILIKKLRDFRIYSNMSQSTFALKDNKSFASRVLMFHNKQLQTYSEKEFIQDYFQSKESFIDSLVQVNFVLGLLSVKENIEFFPWFRLYHSTRLNRVCDRLKNDFAYAMDVAKNLFDESYESFTTNFAGRCDILNKKQSSAFWLDNYAPRDLFAGKES